jgi:hypothetical protein
MAQWRKYQLYSIDAVEQVHAKSRFLGHFLQIDRRRGDEAVRCGAAIQTKIVLVQHEQQLALRHQVQFVDAIQKKSAAVLKEGRKRGGWFTGVIIVFPDDFQGRKTTDFQQTASSFGLHVKHFRDSILACTALTLQQDREIRLRQKFEIPPNLLHMQIAAEERACKRCRR